MSERQTFPILGNGGARIDWQLVLDHGEQAKQNHNQSVTRLAERGGLSWCELHAVLHDKRYQKMDTNEAMLACRALEARYLQAVCADLPPTLSVAMELPEVQDVLTLLTEARAELIALRAEVATLRASEARMREALVEHNDLLRSTFAIAEREGVKGMVASTNWDAFYNRVAVLLKRHHAIGNEARAALAAIKEPKT